MELLLSGFTLGIFVVLLIFGLVKLKARLSEFRWTVTASSNSIGQLFAELQDTRTIINAQNDRIRSVDNLSTEMLNATARLARRYNELEAEVKVLQRGKRKVAP